MRMRIRRNNGVRLLIFFSLICAVVGIPALSGAAGRGVSSAEPMMTITVTNNSSHEVYHLYLSPVDRNNWGPDLMDGVVLTTGQTFTINDVSCSGNEIKIIAEDKTGCFLYGIVGCGQTATTWTITDQMPADCGN